MSSQCLNTVDLNVLIVPYFYSVVNTPCYQIFAVLRLNLVDTFDLPFMFAIVVLIYQIIVASTEQNVIVIFVDLLSYYLQNLSIG